MAIELAGCKQESAKLLWVGSIPTMASTHVVTRRRYYAKESGPAGKLYAT